MLRTSLRTHSCGELNRTDTNKKVALCGWCNKIRNHGRVIFIDLRDRYGLTQIVFTPESNVFVEANKLSREDVIKITGTVKLRPKNMKNKDIETGEIEVEVNKLEILNKSKIPPFEIESSFDLNEEIRMKYRYLDLRRKEMQRNLIFRDKVVQAIREYYSNNQFIEIETPMLVRPTPEGARDYIVPSRVNPGKFYALPQSPQLYKQILMISGFDRYFQVARCLRDEDLRVDRQPEHTQIDLELSFVEAEDVMQIVEGMYKHVFKKVLGIVLEDFKKLTYEEAIEKYGTDKPDLRKNKDDPNEFVFCWIIDFPLFSYDKENKRWEPEHHMFSSPKREHREFLEKDPGKVMGDLFDIVLNGVELGSGSIRINNPELQEKVMRVIGMTKEEAWKKFGFLLKAYEYGGPIHGGMGLGLDRFIALMLGYDDIREVIAFPKNKAAQCLMDGSPSDISDQQLKETHIKTDIKKSSEKKIQN